jgi:hypothetical protein
MLSRDIVDPLAAVRAYIDAEKSDIRPSGTVLPSNATKRGIEHRTPMFGFFTRLAYALSRLQKILPRGRRTRSRGDGKPARLAAVRDSPRSVLIVLDGNDLGTGLLLVVRAQLRSTYLCTRSSSSIAVFCSFMIGSVSTLSRDV